MAEIEMKSEKNRKSTVFIFAVIILFLLFLSRTVFFRNKSHLVFDDTQKYAGIYLNDPKDFQKFQVKPDIVAWFEPWYSRGSTIKLDLCSNKQNAIPFISWEPHNIRLNDIASGEEDDYIRQFLETLSRYTKNTDVLIRFAHEMEMRPKYKFAWYGWQAENDPDAYIAAWQHIVTLGREIDPSIKWVWSPNRSDKYSAPFYPGDEYVDYVGITLNLREDDEYYNLYRNFRDFYVIDGIREHLESYGKKIIITEAGYSNPDSEKKQDFLRSAFDYLIEDPMLAGIVFYNERITSFRDYNITDNPDLMKEFNEGLKTIQRFRQKNHQEP